MRAAESQRVTRDAFPLHLASGALRLLDALEFVGAPGSLLDGYAGTTQDTSDFVIGEVPLPAGFWLEGMSTDFGHDEGLGIRPQEERPILRLRGRAREGTEATTQLFQDFVSGMRASLPGISIEERMGDTAAFFTLDLSAYGRSPSGTLRDEAGGEDG